MSVTVHRAYGLHRYNARVRIYLRCVWRGKGTRETAVDRLGRVRDEVIDDEKKTLFGDHIWILHDETRPLYNNSCAG